MHGNQYLNIGNKLFFFFFFFFFSNVVFTFRVVRLLGKQFTFKSESRSLLGMIFIRLILTLYVHHSS